MQLPLRAFWLMCNQIARIEADQDQRRLAIALAAQSAEGAKNLAADLSDKVGEVVTVNVGHQLQSMKFDREGFEALRSLQG